MRLAAVLVLAGCATASPDPDVAVLEGCWSSDDAITMRLAPEQGSDELTGYLVIKGAGPVPYRTRYAFAPDGSRLTVGEGQFVEVFRRDRDLSDEGSVHFTRENPRRGWRWWHTFVVAGDALHINNGHFAAYESVPDMVIDFKREDCGPPLAGPEKS